MRTRDFQVEINLALVCQLRFPNYSVSVSTPAMLQTLIVCMYRLSVTQIFIRYASKLVRSCGYLEVVLNTFMAWSIRHRLHKTPTKVCASNRAQTSFASQGCSTSHQRICYAG